MLNSKAMLYSRPMRFAQTPALLFAASLMSACSGDGETRITTRDVVGEYRGTGYLGIAPGPRPIKMSILVNGTFNGDISIPDAYVRHTGTWNFGKYVRTRQCREIEFRLKGHLLGVKCASVGPDGVTGLDCDVNRGCSMRRRLDLQPIRMSGSR